ncbi:MAG: pyridoxal-phosphate dependent enzyme [Proteobacteria bacterium]|nr:pyridoxal-phosphate dependent enzyme [Pseudomonadota bacterium]
MSEAAPRPELQPALAGAEIEAARRRIADIAIRTPLVRAQGADVRLKLECLQPYGSYKIRGATNVVRARIEAGETVEAVVSASAGNFGQAVAAAARALGLPCLIHVPDVAARVKVESLKRLGAEVREHPFAGWWEIMQTRETGLEGGTFFHPVCEREVVAGAAVIGDEIAEDFPEVETVFIPIGGGGLACGVAQGVKLARPDCRIVAVETEVSTPLKAAFEAGRPVTVERRPSFIDGMGSTGVLEPMWPLLQRWIDEVVVVSLAEVEDAIRKLAREQHVVTEGAGAAAYAAALANARPNAVAIVSGGNIDAGVLADILKG